MNCRNHPDRKATHQDSVPDVDQPGIGINEAGYKTIYLCADCAQARGQINTSRVAPFPLTLSEVTDTLIELWDTTKKAR